jgi:hypothetical protein
MLLLSPETLNFSGASHALPVLPKITLLSMAATWLVLGEILCCLLRLFQTLFCERYIVASASSRLPA